MHLYHYAPAPDAPDIAREGITRGAIMLPTRALLGGQWLTDDPTCHTAPGANPAIGTVRHRVVIPRARAAVDVRAYTVLAEQLRLPPSSRQMFEDALALTGQPSPLRWWFYIGNIPAAWLRGPSVIVRAPAAEEVHA